MFRICYARSSRVAHLFYCALVVFGLISCSSSTLWTKSRATKIVVGINEYYPLSPVLDFSSQLKFYDRFIFPNGHDLQDFDVWINNSEVISGGASGTSLFTEIHVRIKDFELVNAAAGEIDYEEGGEVRSRAVLLSQKCAHSVYLSAININGASSFSEENRSSGDGCLIFKFERYISPRKNFSFKLSDPAENLLFTLYFKPVQFLTHSH